MKKIFYIVFVFLLVLIFAACEQMRIEIKDTEELITEVSDPMADPQKDLEDYSSNIYQTAFDLWKRIGFFRDFGDEDPITQEFIREIYSNYLLYGDRDYDFFERFIKVEELDDFSKNYFGVSFLSLKDDIPPNQMDEEKGIKVYLHPQLYPDGTIYTFVDSGKEGDNYYFVFRLNYNFEGILDKNRENVENVVRVSFQYEDSHIFFVGQESKITFLNGKDNFMK